MDCAFDRSRDGIHRAAGPDRPNARLHGVAYGLDEPVVSVRVADLDGAGRVRDGPFDVRPDVDLQEVAGHEEFGVRLGRGVVRGFPVTGEIGGEGGFGALVPDERLDPLGEVAARRSGLREAKSQFPGLSGDPAGSTPVVEVGRVSGHRASAPVDDVRPPSGQVDEGGGPTRGRLAPRHIDRDLVAEHPSSFRGRPARRATVPIGRCGR